MRCRATGKVGHPTREAAMAARRRMNVVLSAYRCSKCRQWHLGNTGNTKLANINRLFDKIKQDTNHD